MNNQSSKVRSFLIVALAALLFVPAISQANDPVKGVNPFIASSTTKAILNPDEQSAVKRANELSQLFRSTAKQLLPTLVAIETTVDAADATTGTRNPFANPRSNESASGIGSGVIVDPSGVILTNNHVIMDGRGSVNIRLHDGREFPAVEVLTDPKTDLAVVRISGAGELMAAPMGDSDASEIGDWVLALGQPFGLESTVTAGIISAKQRGIGMNERESYLQTDAAINPGNSGGPLVNLHGEVIGINTAISSRSGGNEGIGFAVPINLARWVGGQLIEHGVVRRSFIGVGVQEIDADLARQFRVRPRGGVIVTLVQPGGAAERAQLQVGDVIVSFNEKQVRSPAQLQLVVEQSDPGNRHSMSIVRDGRPMDVKIRPMQSASKLAARKVRTERIEKETKPESKLGFRIESIRPELAEQIGLVDEHGVVVTAIQKGSAAQQAGLKPGLVIAEVNRQPIRNMQDFADAMKDADPGEGILLMVKVGEASRFLVLKSTS